MIYHVLPGDAQVNDFRQIGLEGELLVCREALVDGDIIGDTLDEFFNTRAGAMNQACGEDPATYNADVASQFRRLLDVGSADEVNLWFEYELFCSVNMWFCLSLLRESGADVYRVAPSHLSFEDRWDGFGNTNAEVLKECFRQRTKLSETDIALAAELWQAFRKRDSNEILQLTSEPRLAFPYLDEVGRAAAELDSKPAGIIEEIKQEGIDDFSELFPEFRRRAGVFGFGDLQVKQLMDE